MTPNSGTRLCFVIMPFSGTDSCTEEEWTTIFETLIKPTVEGATDLGYECRRSSATRGNIVGSIIESLQAAHVVIADLTDQNPNVFYELGARHTLADRTILISQDREHIPFDLKAYANHVYDWRTPEGREKFAKKVVALLHDVDEKPDRPDNPISDFLGAHRPTRQSRGDLQDRLELLEQQVQVLGQQSAVAAGGQVTGSTAVALEWLRKQTLLDAMPEGVRAVDLVQALASSKNEVLLRSFMRRSERALLTAVGTKVGELNTPVGGGMQEKDIPVQARRFVDQSARLMESLVAFALACVEEAYRPGVVACIRISGALVSASEGRGGSRFAIGLPAYLGWRLMLLMGTKAVDIEDFDMAGLIINEPIEVQLIGGQTSFEPLWAQKRLFHPEAFLGYASYAVQSVDGALADSAVLQQAFPDEVDYHRSLVVFLILVAIRHAGHVKAEYDQLYPGYRLLKEARSTIRWFDGYLREQHRFRKQVANVLEESDELFQKRWPERARILNSAKLGDGYFHMEHDFDVPKADAGK